MSNELQHNLVDAWPGDKRDETFDDIEQIEDEVGRAVAKGFSQGERDAATIDFAQAVFGERAAQEVAQDAFTALGVVGRDTGGCVQVVAIGVGAQRRQALLRIEEYRNLGLMHRELVNNRLKILESYLAPAAFELDGTRVKKATWLLAVRVVDDDLWQKVKAGDLAGFSIGGSAVKVPVKA